MLSITSLFHAGRLRVLTQFVVYLSEIRWKQQPRSGFGLEQAGSSFTRNGKAAAGCAEKQQEQNQLLPDLLHIERWFRRLFKHTFWKAEEPVSLVVIQVMYFHMYNVPVPMSSVMPPDTVDHILWPTWCTL